MFARFAKSGQLNTLMKVILDMRQAASEASSKDYK